MKMGLYFFIIFYSVNLLALEFSAEVKAIHDGDTIQIKLKDQKKFKKVRLMGVDTPETDYLGLSQGESATRARDYLKTLLPIGSIVTIVLDSKNSDVHDRLLAHIFYQNQNINQLMLESGMAFFYFIYPFDKTYFVKYSAAAQKMGYRF